MEPLISVIVPIYNVENYLTQCIESIIRQTYTNLEIILVDDGSQDRSGKICDKYANLDSRIKVVHKQNEGVSVARNTGLALADGDYISFVDGDDYIKPDMYRCAIDAACGYKCDAVFWGYSKEYEQDVEDLKTLKPIVFGMTGMVNAKDAMMLVQGSYCTSVWNKLYRREVCRFEENNLWIEFDKDIDLGEDEIWLYEILARCKSIYVDNHELYVYRQRSGSLTHNYTWVRLAKEVEVGERVNRIARKIGMDMDYSTAAIVYIRCYTALIEAYKCKDYALIEMFREKCRIYQRRHMKARQHSLVGKLKKRINIALIDMHFPVWIIDRIDRMSH